MIHTKVTPYIIGERMILRLPKDASSQLSSRGMVMVEGTINGRPFQAPLEPDGQGSHWMETDTTLQKAAGIEEGTAVSLDFAASAVWPRPEISAELNDALRSDLKVRDLWNSLTPNTQWEWIRWIRSSGRAETRQRHVEVAISKMQKGMRRPCCFNRNMCTVSELAKNGVLMEPAPARV